LKKLRELQLAENLLTYIDGLDDLEHLKTLDLSYNQISSLKGLQNQKNLEEFWINCNKVENFDDLDLLAFNRKLNTVYLGGNPVASYPGYRQKLIELLPDLDQIDATYIKTQINLLFSGVPRELKTEKTEKTEKAE